jgi:predicted nucleic acid-binding protein
VTTQTITVADLASELGATVPEIGRRVSVLCRELGPKQVVHTAVSSNAKCLLHGDAADLIRLDLAKVA